VLKPGGHLLSFAATRTYHRMTCGLEDAGFEIRDTLAWMFGSGFPKSLNLDGEWDGWGTALKPAFEPIALARKPLAGTVARNVSEHGTGALNVDGCRIKFASEEDQAAAAAAAAQRATGDQNANRTTYGRFENGPASLAPYLANMDKGRWPANVLLDDEAAAMLDAQTGESVSRIGQPRKGRSGDGWGMSSTGAEYDDFGGASRFFYCAKVSRAERNAGLDAFPEARVAQLAGAISEDADDDVSQRFATSKRNVHPTVKPISLMRWLCRLVTPPGGTVLDPFLGSGSTGCAAVLEGFRFVGCEREQNYMDIAQARVAFWAEHGEDGLRICAERDAAQRQRQAVAEAGQLDLMALLDAA
jgi:site-specific DNA-methyltransferase (adenine-specific)